MFIYPQEQSYDCIQCAKGCRKDWTVEVDSKSAKLIAESPVELKIAKETGMSGLLGDDESGFRTRKTESGCVYLQGDGLCRIHAEVAYESKPLSCREFPFIFTETPDGVYVGVSYFCSSVQENKGRPIEDHEENLSQLYTNYGSRRPRVGFEPMQAGFERSLNWETYRAFEAGLRADLQSAPPQKAVGLNLLTLFRALSQSTPELSWDALQEARPEPGELRVLESEEVKAHTVYFGAILVGMMEAEHPENRIDVAQDLLSGNTFTLPDTAWTGSYPELQQVLDSSEETLRDDWSRRYLQALIHRKVTVLHRPLAHSLVLLYLLPWVLDFHAALACSQRGGLELESGDFRLALDKVEGNLVAHAGGYENFFAFFAETYRELLSAER